MVMVDEDKSKIVAVKSIKISSSIAVSNCDLVLRRLSARFDLSRC